MAFKKGNQCKFYAADYPTGTVGSWAGIDFGEPHETISDLTQSISKSSEEVSIRTSTGWNATVAGNKSGTVSFEMPHDPADPLAGIILPAFFGDSYICCAVMDGPLETPGSSGIRAVFDITKCDRKETSGGVVSYSVEMAVTYDAVLSPEWYVVGN